MISTEERTGLDSLDATITLSDGTVLSITGSDVVSGTVQITDDSSDTSTFSIGYAAMKTLKFGLYNGDDTYSKYDFNDAKVVACIVNNGVSYRKGRFHVYSPTSKGSKITLMCYDTMYETETEYETSLTFPATLGDMLYEASTTLGFSLTNTTFPNSDMEVSEEPNVSTWRQLIGYIAQCAGCVARFDVNDQLEMRSYDKSIFDTDYDGGYYDNTEETAYESGDSADGGDYTFSDTEDYDGGDYEYLSSFHHIYSLSDYEIATDDTVITGISIKTDDETYTYGDSDYMLQISSNPLIDADNVEQVMSQLAETYVGMRFRKMGVKCRSDFTMEVCDPAYLTDPKGNVYHCYLTNISYTMGGYCTVSNAAETKAKNNLSGNSTVTRLLNLTDEQSEQKISKYKAQQEYFNELALNMFGMYYSEETLEDGSVIKYGHNAPTLEDSTYAWKSGSEGFFISKDGGQTWIYGWDSNGNAVLNILYAIGIQAEWINVKGLVVENDDEEVTLQIDDDGNITINAKSIQISGESAATATELAAKTAHYGTCETEAEEAAKIVECSGFTLYTGATISVYFTNANEADTPTLNVNGTGAKPVYAYGVALSSGSSYNWDAGATVNFVYNGTEWSISDSSALAKIKVAEDEISARLSTISSNVNYYGTSATDASTSDKAVSCTSFVSDIENLSTGAVIAVYFSNANEADYPTLNVNGTGSIPIYAYGSTLSSDSEYNWKAKSLVAFSYTGAAWQLIDAGAYASLALVIKKDDDGNSYGTLSGNADRIEFNTGQLAINSPEFTLNSNGATFSGNLSAATGTFAGELVAATGTFAGELKAATGSFSGEITATSGAIGGFTIDSTSIYKMSSVTSGTESTQYELFLYAPDSPAYSQNAISVRSRSYDGSSYGTWTYGFYVRYDGHAYILNGATIGGWYIGSTISGTTGAIYNGCTSADSTTAGTYIGTDAIRQYASSSAYVHIADGVITAVGGNFSGKITAGSGSSFGGWTIADDAIYRTSSAWGASGGMYFGSSGLSVGSTFTVSSVGHLTCTSATIGGFTVDASSFTSDGISISSDGITAASDSTATVSGGTVSTKLDDDDNTYVQIIGDSIYMFGPSGNTSGSIMGRLKPAAASEIYNPYGSAYSASTYGMYFGLPSYSSFFCLGQTVSGSDTYYPAFNYMDSEFTFFGPITIKQPASLASGSGSLSYAMLTMVDESKNYLQAVYASDACLYFGTEDTVGTYLYGDAIYVNVSIKVSSDARLKTDIGDISEYSGVFDEMQALTYRYKASPDKLHFGFTTQGTEEAFSTNGYDPEDYAILGTFEKDGETYGALAHEEIIALLVYEVQQLKAQVSTLQAAA